MKSTITRGIILGTLFILNSFVSANAQIEYRATQADVPVLEMADNSYHYVAPNPFSDVTYICFSYEKEANYKLIITNKMGKNVIVKNGKVSKGDNRIEVFRNGLPVDKYFYRLILDNKEMKRGRLYVVN